MKAVLAGVAVILVCLVASAPSFASQLYVIAFPNATSGFTPRGTLYRDGQGNLFGTTVYAGEALGQPTCQCGNIFKIGGYGVETVLYTFQDNGDGAYPFSGVIQDSLGNLYGTTHGDEYASFGSLYKLAPNGTLTTLYAFCQKSRCTDGEYPIGGLVMDAAGDLYGTTGDGGDNGYGTVYRYKPDGAFTVLYSFRDGNDGGYPLSDLIIDATGNLYGTASQGGNYGGGTIFELTHNRRYEILHAFRGSRDGAYPEFGLTRDSLGNLYGTTSAGGSMSGCAQNGGVGCGTIFKLAPDRTETVLYRFQNRADGSWPSGLVLDLSGNLFGASRAGSGQNDQGAIFELTAAGSFQILQSISCAQDGCLPYDSLIRDNSGNLYGTMAEGGVTGCNSAWCGTVFELTRP